jgi:hypothetical protein
MTSFAIDKKSHKDASKQSKIRNMTKSSNPNEVAVAKKKLKSKIELPPNPQIEGLKIVDLIVTEINNDVFEDHMNKSCGKGKYYCYTDKKCKKVPSGYHVGGRGRLVQDDDDQDENDTNGNGGNGGDGGGDGGGMGENLILRTCTGEKFAEIIDLIRPEDVMPKMKAADQWVNEEDSYDQAKKELKATKKARDQRHKSVHAATDTKGNVDVNESLDDKRKANLAKQKQRTASFTSSNQKTHSSQQQQFAKAAASQAKAKARAKERSNISKEIDAKVSAATQSEEAVSKKQQRFFGMVRAAQKGEGASSPEVAKVASEIGKKDAKDFASTKHKGLPEKKKQQEEIQMTVDEAVRLPSEFGHIVMVGVQWRAKMYNIRMFFPQQKMPSRGDVQDEIVKVYPGGKVVYFQRDELASNMAQFDNDKNPLIKVTKEGKRWQDDDGDGKWYEKSDVDGKISKREKKAKNHNCASKVKHEEYGIGNCIPEAHDLDEDGNVAHYDVEFEEYIVEGVPVEHLEILVTEMHEHVIPEGKGEKNCGCGQDPCITYGKKKNAHKMPDGTVMPGKTHKEEAKAKYDNTKSPDYEKKRKALAKKHGGEENIKGHPQYENRMASHTAGMSDAQKDMASSQVSKGFAYKHGRRLDKANFGDRKKEGKRGNPPSYRKSADSPEMELRYPYGKSNIKQGKGSFKGLKKEELLKSLRGFMGEGKIADAMRANLEKMKASDAKSSKNLDNFLKKSKKVRDQDNS